MASASVIEKQNLEGDHSDAPMETEATKSEGKEDMVGRPHATSVVSTVVPRVSRGGSSAGPHFITIIGRLSV